VPLVQPLQEFLRESTSSSWVLVAAVVAALVWVNSPWGASYDRLWSTPLVLHIGDLTIGSDLAFWISSGLMTFFFLVVGLEIKREVTIGELRRPQAVRFRRSPRSAAWSCRRSSISRSSVEDPVRAVGGSRWRPTSR